MSDNFRLELIEVIAPRARQNAKLRCRVVQAHPDANHLRAFKNDISKRRDVFAGRLLADAPVPAFSTPEPWTESARFPFLAKSQPVTYLSFVSHDLIRLIHDEPETLRRLAAAARWPELDVAAQREFYGDEAQEPVVRDEPDHYSNYVDEAVLEFRLAGALPPECVVGLSWGSAAF